MTRRQTKSISIVVLLLLIADFAMVVFVFPLYCLGVFAAAALLPMLLGWARSVYDPVSELWEVCTLSPKAFHSWAHRFCDPKRYGPSKERFLSMHRMTPLIRMGMLLSKIRALTYVHAVKLLLPLLSGLLIYEVYELVGGHTAVWTDSRLAGGGMGGVWGFCFGLFMLWRSGTRYQSQAEKAAAVAVKSS